MVSSSEPYAFAVKGMTLRDQWDAISSMFPVGGPAAVAFLEVVHSMPKQGVVSTFKFGQSYGNLEAFLTAAEIPFERVTPSVW